jgi:flavodoxin
MKAVIVYYSLEGNAELIANMISARMGADVIKLIPEKKIAKDGFKKFFWGGKSVIFKEKPRLMNDNLVLDKYDTVIIGTPIWAGSFTPPINTFLTESKIKGKSIYLFACHSGGGTQKCFERLKQRLKDNTIISTAEFLDPTKNDMNSVAKLVDSFCKTIKM